MSRQNINANCNTPPLSINEIEYHQDRDEYTIKLPKIEGIHKDLKEVKLLLSSKNEAEGVKTTIVPINASTQDSLYTLTIKGNQDGQLANPAGDRVLKAIVYDKAGLNSNAEKPSERHFTVLTLEPPNVDVDLDEVKNGVEAPKIKELVEYFQEEKYWEAAGYSVSYESTNFDYDPSKKKFMPKDPNLAKGEYKVTVKLSFGSNHLTEDYKINVLGNDEAGINTGKFAITDVTNYVNQAYPNLTIEKTPTFVNDGPNGKTCEVIVPYTSYKTKLKVHVEAVGNGTIRRNPSDVDKAKARDLLVEDLGEDSGSEETLTFYAYASDNTTNKIYTIKFIRGGSVNVTAYLMNKVLQSNDCKLQMNWVYRENEINIQKTEESKNGSLTVARGAEVTFTITTGEKDVIKKCSSNDAGHPQITIDNPKTISFKLTANAGFDLTADVGAEASFKWVDIKGNDSTGYTKARVQYHFNDTPQDKEYISGTPAPEEAIQKGKACKFSIEGLNPERHIVTKWKVNEAEIKQDGGNFKVSSDLTSLTIENPEGDYEVKVFTAPLYELTLEVCDSNGASITGHNYSFEVRKGTPTGGEIQKNPLGKYAGILSNIPVYITAQEGSNSKYDIVRWESNKTTDATFAPLTGSGEINKRNLNITKDTTVKLILKKKTYKVEWSVEGGDQNITPPELKTRIKLNGGAPNPQGSDYVEIGAYALFELDPLEEGRTIKGWKVDGVEYLAGDSSKGITMSSDKKKLTLTNIRQAHTVKLVLEPKKYTVTVYIHKPEEAIHSYTLKATKNGDEITGSMGAGTTNGDTKYTYSDVEHGSEMIFEATTQGSIYEIEKWQYKARGEYFWRDVTGTSMTPSQYEDMGDLKKLKWTVDDTTILRVVLKKKTFRVAWSVTGATGVNITTKVNSSVVTPPSSTNCSAVIGANIEFSIATVPAGKKIKGWNVNGNLKTANETGITIEDDKKKLTLINIQQAYTVVLVLEDVIYRVEVDIEPPQAGISPPPHNYTIKATKGGSDIQPDTGTTIFPSVKPGEIELEAVLSDPSISSSYIVEKWQYKLPGGSWTSLDDSHYVQKPTKIKYTINSDIDFKVVLKYKPVKFTVVPNGSSACNLIIKDKDDVELKRADIFDLPTFVDVDSNGKKRLKVSLSGYVGYEVVLWKINGEVEKSFFDREWKNAIEHEFKAGDEVEVTLEKIIKLGFFFGDGYFYNVNEQYKGKIKITITASEGQVFPNGDKGTVIDNDLILESDNAFFIEHVDEKVSFKVTRNAKIKIHVEDLPSGKTVSWKYLDKNKGPQPFSGENVPSENAMNPVKNWKIIEAYNNMLILMQIRSI